MAKRTKRRNDRYSHKRNSRGKRVSKRRRRVSRRRVSKKTYKHKNMRGGMEGRNADMTDEEAAIRESQGEAGAGVAPGTGSASGINPVEGKKTIYDILNKAGLLKYYNVILGAGYDDSTIESEDFLYTLKDSLRFSLKEGTMPEGTKGGHIIKIINAFSKYKEEKARVAGGPSPRPAPVSGSGASFQPAQAAPEPEPVALAQPMAVAQPMGYGSPMPMAVAQAYTPPDPALVDIIRRNMVTPAAAAGGFGAQSAKCDHCKSNLKHPGYSYCSHSCGIAAKSAGGFGASALPAGSGAYAPSYQPAPAQVAAPESRTITLTNKVTARDDNGKYKMDIPPHTQITIYFSGGGIINEKVIEPVRKDGTRGRSGLHYWVHHGHDWSWVSEYDLNQAGAALGAAALGAAALDAPAPAAAGAAALAVVAAPAAAGAGGGGGFLPGFPTGRNMCIKCSNSHKWSNSAFCTIKCRDIMYRQIGHPPSIPAGATPLHALSNNQEGYRIKDQTNLKRGDGPVPEQQPPIDTNRYIYFYSKNKYYYQFANFYPCVNFNVDGHIFANTELYFQCMKFIHIPRKYEECKRCKTARAVFSYAADNQPQVNPRWHKSDNDRGIPFFNGEFYPWLPGYRPKFKDLVMYKAVYLKFTQDKYLKHLLLYTGDKILVEHSYADGIWGDRNFQAKQEQWQIGKEENHLGQILMLVRMDIHPDNIINPGVIARYNIVTNPF